VIHDGMPYDPIQGQGQGHTGPKVAKMADFSLCPPPVCMRSKDCGCELWQYQI